VWKIQKVSGPTSSYTDARKRLRQRQWLDWEPIPSQQAEMRSESMSLGFQFGALLSSTKLSFSCATSNFNFFPLVGAVAWVYGLFFPLMYYWKFFVNGNCVWNIQKSLQRWIHMIPEQCKLHYHLSKYDHSTPVWNILLCSGFVHLLCSENPRNRSRMWGSGFCTGTSETKKTSFQSLFEYIWYELTVLQLVL
jgi:hypothetical protein